MIVPSGKRRFMKYQQVGSVVNQDPNAEQVEYQSDDGPAFDFSALQDQLQGGEEQSVPSSEELDGAVDQGLKFPGQGADVGVPGSDEVGETEGGLRDKVFSTLVQLGVPERQVSSMSDKLFQGKKDLTNNTLKGNFLIPSYAKSKKISQDEAETIAKSIGQEYGLALSISNVGNNFKVDFQTQQLARYDLMGSSFDELNGGSGGEDGQQRAAQTQTEMIKISHKGLIDSLLNIGLGDKK